MRFFVALEVDEDGKDYLLGVIKNLRDILGTGNYTFRNNLHLTLAFCTDITEDDCERLYKALKVPLSTKKEVADSYHKIDCFEKNTSQLFFLKLQDENDSMKNIASIVREAMDKLNIVYDRKPFLAHITLARDVKADLARQTAKSLKFDDFSFCFGKVAFMKSERKDNRMKYTPLYEIELKHS